MKKLFKFSCTVRLATTLPITLQDGPLGVQIRTRGRRWIGWQKEI